MPCSLRRKAMREVLAILCVATALFFSLLFLKTGKVWGHEAHEPHAQWFKSQRMNPETKKRLGVDYQSCCDAGDHFPTRFRLVEDGTRYGAETYEYMWRDGTWKRVPQDIIQRKKTPDGRPVLFLNKITGQEYCLIIDEEGI